MRFGTRHPHQSGDPVRFHLIRVFSVSWFDTLAGSLRRRSPAVRCTGETTGHIKALALSAAQPGGTAVTPRFRPSRTPVRVLEATSAPLNLQRFLQNPVTLALQRLLC